MGNVAEPTEEIDEMVSALENSAPEPEPEPEEPESSEEEPPEQTEDSEEPEPEGREDVQAAEDETEEQPSRVEELEKKIERLESQLSEEGEEEEPEQEPEASSEQQNEQLEVQIDFEEDEFVDEETHGEVLTNPEDFNNFLKGFAEKVAARTQEEILQKFPQIVDQRVQQRARAEVTMQQFWDKNEDLNTESKRKVLASKAQEVRSEDPSKPLRKVLEEAERRTREELDLQEQAEEIDEEAQKNPAFTPDQGTGPTPSQENNRDEQVQQMDKMLDAIG